MNRTDAEIQERVDRLFDRFERMTDTELMLLRSVWEEGDASARQDAWTMVKAALRRARREPMLKDARDRITAWVNNYPAMAAGEVQAPFAWSGMDPGSIRKAAIPPMLDAIAATVVADALTSEEQTVLLEPMVNLAP